MKIHEILPFACKDSRKRILQYPGQFGTTRKSPVAHQWVSNSEQHWSETTIRAGTEVYVLNAWDVHLGRYFHEELRVDTRNSKKHAIPADGLACRGPQGKVSVRLLEMLGGKRRQQALLAWKSESSQPGFPEALTLTCLRGGGGPDPLTSLFWIYNCMLLVFTPINDPVPFLSSFTKNLPLTSLAQLPASWRLWAMGWTEEIHPRQWLWLPLWPFKNA